MKRRNFIALAARAATGAAAVALPRRTWAQQSRESLRRIGVLLGPSSSADDPSTRAILEPFRTALEEAGWVEGRTIHVEYRLGRGEPATMAAAAELVALAPDLIYAVTTPAVEAVYRETKTIPIVFSLVADPIGEGWVKSLGRPGGNVTGFVAAEGSQGGKYVQLLLEIAPATLSVGLIFNPKTMPYAPPFVAAAKRAARPAVRIDMDEVASDRDIDQSLASLARAEHGALVVMPDPFLSPYYSHILAETARLRLPAIYCAANGRILVKSGGLMSYTFDPGEQYRQAGIYVIRILKGERAGDLPVQTPTKYDLFINFKTAKAIGLTIPPTLLARADEVIE